MAVSRTLDRVFRASIVLKGLDGVLEIAGGLAILIAPHMIHSLAKNLTEHELSHDPHDFMARHVMETAGGLVHGRNIYAGVYLLSHGLAKAGVVIAVLRDELWAYPAMMALLGAFIVYQLYRLSFGVTLGLSVLTVFDGFVVWLTWREYAARRGRSHR